MIRRLAPLFLVGFAATAAVLVGAGAFVGHGGALINGGGVGFGFVLFKFHARAVGAAELEIFDGLLLAGREFVETVELIGGDAGGVGDLAVGLGIAAGEVAAALAANFA